MHGREILWDESMKEIHVLLGNTQAAQCNIFSFPIDGNEIW
jgi:hypothetical protein